MQTVADDPRFKQFFQGMDHVDVKSTIADVSLHDFIAGMFSYHPWWMALLFRMRDVLVRLLGLVRHDPPDRPAVRRVDAISFVPGDSSLFFIVRKAEEERFWIAESPPDKHLAAYLGVVAHRLDAGLTQFHVFTTVRYLHWTGPVYFNLIRPFHHLVVARMMAVAKNASKRGTTLPSTKGSDANLIDCFSLKERLLIRTGWYGFMLIGTWGIFIQAPMWAVVYLLYMGAAFALIILPGLCAHCPYPSEYSACLFMPPAWINRLYPYQGPHMHPAAKILAFAAMAGVVLMPQFWLIAHLPLLVLFWLLALPAVLAFPRHFCRHCRHFDCPMNRTSA